jgi:hypothetical protein
MHWGFDKKNQRYVEWNIGGGFHKRAWIQRREPGPKDYAWTERYLCVVRIEALNEGPKGQAADFPVFADATVTDDQVLREFVDSVCAAVKRPPPY